MSSLLYQSVHAESFYACLAQLNAPNRAVIAIISPGFHTERYAFEMHDEFWRKAMHNQSSVPLLPRTDLDTQGFGRMLDNLSTEVMHL